MGRVAERPHPLLHHSHRLYRLSGQYLQKLRHFLSQPLDTRRYRVNKIEGGEPSRWAPNTPDPQATMAMSSVGLSGMPNSHFLRSADRPLCSIQALVFRFPTREED